MDLGSGPVADEPLTSTAWFRKTFEVTTIESRAAANHLRRQVRTVFERPADRHGQQLEGDADLRSA